MFVEAKDEMIKELKRERQSDSGIEVEYEFQFAWDRYATFLNAQSRAIAELRSSIKQFLEIAREDDERRLKLQVMQAQVDRKSTRLNSSHVKISYAVFCLKKKIQRMEYEDPGTGEMVSLLN